MSLLEVEGLCAAHGSFEALRHVSLRVEIGEIVSVIGSGGAGKSTLLHALCRLIKPTAGRVIFDGVELTDMDVHEIARRGLILIPESRRIFPRLTVLDNLRMGAYWRRDRRIVQRDLDTILSRLPRLKERANQPGGSLAAGEQQMLAFARGWMARPRLMMLDEPSLGLAPMFAHELYELIKMLPNEGISVLLVEQNADPALAVANRALLMHLGTVVVQGLPADVRRDPRMAEAYAGWRV